MTDATAAANVTVTLYNGATGAPYGSSYNVTSDFTFHGTLGDGNDYYSLSLPSNGIQNGAPDGIAVDLAGAIQEFWSYEGTFVGVGGPANGVLSVDVGVSEPPAPVGSSLQRIGFGSTWLLTEGSNTRGDINVPEPASLSLLALSALGAAIRRRRRCCAH